MNVVGRAKICIRFTVGSARNIFANVITFLKIKDKAKENNVITFLKIKQKKITCLISAETLLDCILETLERKAKILIFKLPHFMRHFCTIIRNAVTVYMYALESISCCSPKLSWSASPAPMYMKITKTVKWLVISKVNPHRKT